MNQILNRTKFNASLNNYLREVHCICPKCGGNSIISAGSEYSMPWVPFNVKFICLNCTYRSTGYESKDSMHFVNFNYAEGLEPYFGYQLRFHINIKGHPLFIFNLKHAEDIVEYVAVEDRPNPENSKWSMVNRLPKWVKLSKNRKAVLKSLTRLIDEEAP